MEIQSLNHERVLSILPDRNPYAHKGDFGKVLLICGSRGYTGAAALSAMGCLRSGAGLVYVAVPECIYQIMAVKLTEAIVLPFPSQGDTFSASACERLLPLLKKMDAVLIGPGLGQSEGTLAVLRMVMEQFHGTVIVDADGINLLAHHKHLLRGRTAPTVLTPHGGEYRRLDPEQAMDATEFTMENKCIVVLKGHETLITDGKVSYRNGTGNPGMAVGGSGDVLAGMIVSLVGQGIAALEAAAVAVWLHGAAGDKAAQRLGQYGMLPTDLLEELPRLMK